MQQTTSELPENRTLQGRNSSCDSAPTTRSSHQAQSAPGSNHLPLRHVQARLGLQQPLRPGLHPAAESSGHLRARRHSGIRVSAAKTESFRETVPHSAAGGTGNIDQSQISIK